MPFPVLTCLIGRFSCFRLACRDREKDHLESGQDFVSIIQFNINSPIQKVLQDNPDTYSEFGIVDELFLLP